MKIALSGFLAVALLAGCAPKVIRPDPRACVVPAAILVPRPLPTMAGQTWRDVADYAARAADHARAREADVATVARLCNKGQR